MSQKTVFGSIDNVLTTIDFKDMKENWVAIVDDKIVAKGTNAKKVYDEATSKYPRKYVFIGKFPENRAMLL